MVRMVYTYISTHTFFSGASLWYTSGYRRIDLKPSLAASAAAAKSTTVDTRRQQLLSIKCSLMQNPIWKRAGWSWLNSDKNSAGCLVAVVGYKLTLYSAAAAHTCSISSPDLPFGPSVHPRVRSNNTSCNIAHASTSAIPSLKWWDMDVVVVVVVEVDLDCLDIQERTMQC